MKAHSTRTAAICVALLILGSPSLSRGDSLQMAHGWSVNPSGGQVAVDEAIAMMQEGVTNPEFIVLYTTADYGEQEAARTLRSRFPEAKLFGMNVYKGVFSSDGLHIGERGSLAIMGFSGGDLAYGVGIRKVPDGADVTSITKGVLEDAARDAGKTLGDVPSVVLLAPVKGAEDAAVAGVGAVMPAHVPLVGGTPCDDRFGQGTVIGTDTMCKGGVVVGLIYSQRKIGASFYSGFVGKRMSGEITSGDGRMLKGIDNRPAQEVYREWANGYFDDIDSSKESVVVMSSALCPLARAVRLPSGKMRYVPVRPWRFNPDGSLNMGGDIHSGETIYYVEATKRALRQRAGLVAREAMVTGRIKMNEVAGGLHIYCAGAAKTLGLGDGDDTGKMVAEIRDTMDGKPFIGGFTAGEQGNIPGYGFFHGNLMSSMVVFSE